MPKVSFVERLSGLMDLFDIQQQTVAYRTTTDSVTKVTQ
jgi:hypothetical protein